MKRYATVPVLSLLVTLLLAGPALARSGPETAAAKAAGLDPGKLDELAAEMGKLVEARQIAGAVTLIARKGKVGSLQAVGWKDLEAKTPMRPDTLFRIASMTKPATAVAIMMLVEDGKLAVEDPVEKHLPEFRGLKMVSKREGNTLTLVDPPRPITIADLMTHTSGMRCQAPAGFADLGAKKNRTLAEAVVAYSQQPLDGPPGVTWKYCGTAFDTLGRIVEVAGGRPYEEFLAQRLFRPLGMKDTTFRPSKAQFARLATLYKKEGEANGPGGVVRSENQGAGPGDEIRYPSPGGGLYSTASDYARLLQMLLDGGSVGRGNGVRRLLKPETVATLTRVHFTSKEKVGFTPGLGMGLGVQVVMAPTDVTEMLGVGSFGHGGAHGTQAWADPQNDVVYVLMIQRQGFGNGDLSDVRKTFQRAGASAIVKPKQTANPGSPNRSAGSERSSAPQGPG
jgi:CubicO group peptidase (beta-lactamase class C family)